MARRPRIADWETPEALIRIGGWAKDGLTNEQIAENMGIDVSTLYRWANRSTEICEALKQNKEIADRNVENALYKSARGYQYTEITRERDETGAMVVTKEVVKEVKPNTTAQIFWLKNRLPQIWRDHPELATDAADNPILASLITLLDKGGQNAD